MTEELQVENLKKKIALACRILYMEGLGDLNKGHISGRLPDENIIYMKPSGLGLEEIKPDDIIILDMEGNKLEGEYSPHSETPIHTEIYKIRSDVQSIVHLHPLISTALSSVQIEIKPLNQDSVFFFQGIPIFPSPELITTKPQAQLLAQRLGESNALIIKNHGIVTVGESVEEACLNALFLEKALKLQLIASLFGKIEPIPEKTALKMYERYRQNTKWMKDIWLYLARKLKREGLSFFKDDL